MQEYIVFRSNPANDEDTDGQWASRNGIRIDDLKAWKMAHPEAMQEILSKRRARYAEHLIEVDQALLVKAKGGDVRSIELMWNRFENWSPKIEENNAKITGKGQVKTIADLISEDGA